MTEPELQTQLQTELDPDFQIVRLLGEGSMALVYVAREKALQRLVAIKVLNAEVAEDETARKRFERESRSAAKIHHQNVATVHRVGSLEDETPFIIMEYIEGKRLDEYCDDKRLTVPQRVDLFGVGAHRADGRDHVVGCAAPRDRHRPRLLEHDPRKVQHVQVRCLDRRNIHRVVSG